MSMNPNQGTFFQKIIGRGPIRPQQASIYEESQSGPTWKYGNLKTYEHPITEFFADINIPVNAAGSSVTLRSGVELPNNCVGIRFISVVPGVTASINGGGTRTILNNDTLSGVEISSLIIFTDATGTCIVQAVGTGD